MPHYTVADLESVSAVTAEFFADRRREQRFYKTHCNALSGITGVWAYVREAALILEKQSKAFGQPGEDFDWLQTVDDFAGRIYQYQTPAELAATARECLTANKY